jgi:hypothetical protein
VAILDQVDYESVRRAIDVTLDDGVDDDDDRILPDRALSDPIVGDAVDAEIFMALPIAGPIFPGSLTGSDVLAVKRAAVFLTAARVYPTIPQITQEQIGAEHRYRREYDRPNVSRFRRAPAYRGRMYGTGWS